MLFHPTLDKLRMLKFSGMSHALEEQMQSPDITQLSFEERLGLLVDREITERDNRRLTSRLRQARLKQQACLEDIDYQASRGLDKALLLKLSDCQWVKKSINILITGPTGVGKSWIACGPGAEGVQRGIYRLVSTLIKIVTGAAPGLR